MFGLSLSSPNDRKTGITGILLYLCHLHRCPVLRNGPCTSNGTLDRIHAVLPNGAGVPEQIQIPVELNRGYHLNLPYARHIIKNAVIERLHAKNYRDQYSQSYQKLKLQQFPPLPSCGLVAILLLVLLTRLRFRVEYYPPR